MFFFLIIFVVYTKSTEYTEVNSFIYVHMGFYIIGSDELLRLLS